MVFPIGSDNTTMLADTMCQQAFLDFKSTIVPLIADCISSDAQITAISVEGMINGKVPYANQFNTPVDGTRGAGCVPNQVAALLSWYQDTEDTGPGVRESVAKNSIPGVCKTDVTIDTVETSLFTAMATLALDLQDGWTNTVTGDKKWYRVLKRPKNRTTTEKLDRIRAIAPRGYVVTQRRRLTPRLGG
jgi:hypothetical protein